MGTTTATDGAQLTAGGVRTLRRERPLEDDAPLLLQVLHVHRYLADPALKQLLGDDAGKELDRDVFDVVLSDGRLKTKCILAPAMNHLVWRGQLAHFDVLRITDFHAVQVKDASRNSVDDDDDVTRPVFILKSFEVLPRQSDKSLVHGLSSAKNTDSLVVKETGDNLMFASTVNERETELIPVAGERMYYLPLSSDHYTLESESTRMAAQAKREYCSSLTTPGVTTLHSLNEIAEMVTSSYAGTSRVGREQFPPMVGVVRVKSRMTHFGEPGRANPFPFVFHIVLVDYTSAVEIAFFGSMCARFFSTIEEGDLIQVRGYSVSNTESEESNAGVAEQLFYFEHESEGQVLHLQAKWWKMLGVTEVLWRPRVWERVTNYRKAVCMQPPSPAPIWLECSFANTNEVQSWNARIKQDNIFDFVGVLSFAGKICRRRKRKRTSGDDDGEESGPVTEYRWIKAVNEHSSTELTILLHDCSQPQQFRNLKAGDTIMLTKLLCVDEGETNADVKTGVDDHVLGAQYVTCSSFTVMRVNDAVSAFNTKEECAASFKLAMKLVANAKVREQSSTGESWLEGDMIKQDPHSPQSSDMQAPDAGTTPPSLGRQPYQFGEFTSVCENLEALEHRHVAVVGRLLAIPTLYDEDTVSSQQPTVCEIEFGDTLDSKQSQKVKLRMNPVFRSLDQQASSEKAAIHDINRVTSKAAQCLLEMLSPVIVEELLADASKSISGGGKRKRNRHKKNKKMALAAYQPAGGADRVSNDDTTPSPPATTIPAPAASVSTPLTPAFIEQRLTRSNRVFLFSTHLYRTQDGAIDVEVDAILPYAPEV